MCISASGAAEKRPGDTRCPGFYRVDPYLHKYNSKIHLKPQQQQALSVCSRISNQSTRVGALTRDQTPTLVCASSRNPQARSPSAGE